MTSTDQTQAAPDHSRALIGGVIVFLLILPVALVSCIQRNNRSAAVEAPAADAAQPAPAAADVPAEPIVEVVSKVQIDKAAKDFERIQGRSGMAGAVAYVENCYATFEKTKTWNDLDYCVGFDTVAAMYDQGVSQAMGWSALDYFGQDLVDTRQKAAIATKISDETGAVSRLAAIHAIAQGALLASLSEREKAAKTEDLIAAANASAQVKQEAAETAATATAPSAPTS